MRRVLVSLTSAVLVVAGAFALANRAAPTPFGPVKLVPPIYAGTQPGIDYMVRQSGWSVGFGRRGVAMSLPQGDGTTLGVAWRLAGAGDAQPVPEDRLPTLVSDYDGVHERVGLPSWSAIRWSRALPEADLVLRSRERDLEWSVEFERGADRRRVTVEVEGVDGARLEGRELRLRAGRGELVESGLACRQAEPVACRYTGVEQVREGLWRYEIEADGLDPAQGLVVDPGMAWAVTLSGPQFDVAAGLAPFDGLSFMVVGSTASADFPGTGARSPSGQDGYAMQIGGAGVQPALGLGVLFIRGGGQEDGLRGITQKASGAVLVTGQTHTEKLDGTTTIGSRDYDGFFAEIVASGGTGLRLNSFTYLLSVKGFGAHIATGPDLVVVGGQAFDTSFKPSVWGFTTQNSKKWTKVLASDKQTITGIALTGSVIHIAGKGTGGRPATSSSLAGILGNRPNPGEVGWVMGIRDTGGTEPTEVHFSWIGGTNGPTKVNALLIGPDGRMYVAGETASSDLGTVENSTSGMEVVDSTFQVKVDADPAKNETEAFVIAMSATDDWTKGWTRLWCTALGSTQYERAYGLGWNHQSGRLLVTGALTPAQVLDFPGLKETAGHGLDDVYLTELTVTEAKQEAWTRLLGGASRDFGMAIASVKLNGPHGPIHPVVVVGNTQGTFGTANLGFDAGVNTAYTGTDLNAFVAATDLTPPVVRANAVSDGPSEVKTDLRVFQGSLAATWAEFDDKEDPSSLTYQVGFTTRDNCQAAGSWVVPLTPVGTALTYSYPGDAGLISGTEYFAVVKGSNSSGLSAVACSNGAVFDPIDGGVADARTPKPDTGRAEDTGADPEGPDTGLPLDASTAGLDAGRPDAALGAADAGDTDKQPVLGWGCGCGATGGATPLFGLLLALGLRRRR